MIIRKLRRKNKLNLIVFLVFLFIFVFAFILIRSLYKLDFHISDNSVFSGDDFKKIEGKIRLIDRIGYEEFILESDNNVNYILKDYPKNIQNMVGKRVELKGEMKNSDSNPVFVIKSLKNEDDMVIFDNNNYIFVDELLILNSNDNEYIIANKIGNKIEINYRGNHLIDISAFVCSKISYSRNCNMIIKEFEKNENEYFNSYNGLVYYKIDENKRELFNDLFMGYYLDTSKEDTLLNISSAIDIINSEYLIENKNDIIVDKCNFLELNYLEIISKNGSILDVKAIGKNNDNKTSSCEISFDLMQDWKVLDN